MWFVLRMTFWLAVVLVLLPTGGSQTAPKSQVSAGEAFAAARGAVTDFEHFLREATGSLRSRIADGRHAWPARASRRKTVTPLVAPSPRRMAGATYSGKSSAACDIRHLDGSGN
jgi:hypothetical protein